MWIGNTHFDRVVSNNITLPLQVQNISLNAFNDIAIDFANGLRLEVFNDTNASKHNYRIYDNTKSADYDEAFFDKARNYIKIERGLIRNL